MPRCFESILENTLYVGKTGSSLSPFSSSSVKNHSDNVPAAVHLVNSKMIFKFHIIPSNVTAAYHRAAGSNSKICVHLQFDNALFGHSQICLLLQTQNLRY